MIAFNSCLDLLGFHLEMVQIHAGNELRSFHMQIMENVRALVRIKVQPYIQISFMRLFPQSGLNWKYFCSTILQIV